MGRRRKGDESEKRTDGLKVQLTPSERLALDERAARAGYSILADYVRLLLFSDPRQPLPAARDPQYSATIWMRGLRQSG